MVCLIKSKYKEELDLYTQLLGSEKRAYAILCCNNGYTLDKTKDGKPSKLYNDLLEYYKGDVTKAVQKKAQLFTSEFTKDYGQWYQDGYEISDEHKDVFDENREPLLHNTYFGTADNKILLYEQKEFASIEEEEQYILEHATRTDDNIYKRRGEKRDDHMYSRERAVKYIKDQGYTIHDLEHDTYETRFEVTLEAKIKEEPWRSYIENMDPGLKVKYAGVRIGKKDPRLQVKIITREAESIDSFYKFYNKKSLTTAHDLLQYIIKQTKDENNQNFFFIRAVLNDINRTVPGLFSNINIKLVADNNGNYSAKYDHNTKTIIVNSARSFDNENGFNNLLIQTLVHEMIHAVTVDALQKSKPLRERAERLLSELKKQFNNDPDIQGIQDVYEMVAELSNDEFIKKLQQIQYSTDETLFDKVRRFISTVIRHYLRKIGLQYKNTAYSELANIFVQSAYGKKTGLQMSENIDEKTVFNRNSKKRIQKAKNKIKAKLKEGIHIVGTRDSTQKLIDKLSQDIILGTRSKNKSYSSKRNSSVSYGNERQIARNQEAVNFADEQAKTINEAIAERDAEKQLTEQAKLILDFIDHADSDIHEVLQMLQNARDNDFDLLYYNVDQFGNRLYQDTSGNSITAQTAGRNTIASRFSFDDIQYMTTDVLGYYQKLLTDVDNMLLQVPVGRNAVVDEIRDLINSLNLHEQLRTASNIKRQAQEKMLDFYIDQRINQEESSELTDEMKQRLSINIKKWVKSQYDFGDIGGFQKWTQLISDSKSPVVRMMADEIYKMNQEIDNAVVPRGEQLEKALKEAEGEMSILGNHHPINVMTMLMQKIDVVIIMEILYNQLIEDNISKILKILKQHYYLEKVVCKTS